MRGRPWGAVVADMVEGIVVVNDLDREQADTVRASLWQAVDEPALAACTHPPNPRRRSHPSGGG